MKPHAHTLPFENRWTSGEHAWEWHCELGRIGVPNVRVMFSEHETHHDEEPFVVLGIPPGFVRDWLAFHDKRSERQQIMWRASVIVLGLVSATAALISALR